MIREAKSSEYRRIKEIIASQPLKNIYMFIDIENCGFSSENCKTLLCEEESVIKTILYIYYNSVQLYSVGIPSEKGVKEIADIITENRYSMVTGDVSLVHAIHNKLEDYELTDGGVYQASESISIDKAESVSADVKNCREIAEFICSNDSISWHYEVELLAAQLERRLKYEHCRNFIIKDNNRIIGHFGTYAESDKYAVMGGLLVSPDFRNLKYGERLVKELTADILSDKKCPLLFCFSERTAAWYERLSFKKVRACSKLERINNKAVQ